MTNTRHTPDHYPSKTRRLTLNLQMVPGLYWATRCPDDRALEESGTCDRKQAGSINGLLVRGAAAPAREGLRGAPPTLELAQDSMIDDEIDCMSVTV